ncbi:MAG: prephenate dehydratase [Bacillota bacterium]|nr:prephenate dehydratase [Bacillota bacterium]
MFSNGRQAGPETGHNTSGGDAHGVLRDVGFQGERGAFSEVAALRLEPGADLRPCRTLSDVFNLAESGSIHAAVVPVENSLAGSIGDTYDLLLNHSLTVTGEAVISIEHCLLANPGVTLHDIKRVISHPQALAQCQDYLESLEVEIVPHYDTAGAAKSVRDSSSECTAAIASERAAQVYGLDVLARDIQSRRDNFTRFYRVEREPRPPGQANKTVLAVSLPHYPGSLFMALSSFAARGINLTKIESRPVKRDPWQYIFYLEVEGHASDWQVKSAFDEVRAKTSMMRVLGSFEREGS